MLKLKLAVLVALAGCWFAGCTSPTSTKKSSDGKDHVVLMLNWYPEAEHGGFYAAQVHGIFERHGLDVEIRAGGPSAPVAQEMLTGRVQFGIGNADDVLLFRQQDVDLIALLAPIRNTPRCILVREDSGVTSLDGLKGLVLQANQGQAFLDFMKSKNMLNDVQVVPYGGTVAKLVTDPKTAIQAYSFSEPLMAKQQGVEVRSLMLSDIGFNPYASCLMCTKDYADANMDIVKRMKEACREGWQKYLADPEEANQVILKQNSQGMTIEALDFGAKELRSLCLPNNANPEELGDMTATRWQELVDQFVALGLVEAKKVKAEEAFIP